LEVELDMRTLGIAAVLALVVIVIMFGANPDWRRNPHDLTGLIVVIAIVAFVAISSAVISWRRSRARLTRSS
jgi:membrane protein DedA with SNARE-associated domain